MTAAESRVEKSRSGEKVTVASKMPMALILKLYRMETVTRRRDGTSWDETVAVEDGGAFAIIAGTSYPNGPPPEGVELPDRPQTIAGYALTHNVSKDKWDRWLEANKDTKMVKNHLIFAYPSLDGVRGEAREHKKAQSGLQAINPNDDPRMPKKVGRKPLQYGSLESVE